MAGQNSELMQNNKANQEQQSIIQKAGLTASQAKSYLALMENGALSPAKLSELTGETRTNTYAILTKLEQLNLVRNIGEKKAQYRAENPSNLEILAEKRRKITTKNESEVKNHMSELLDIFYAHNEAPGGRTLIGEEGIKETYRDVLRTGQTVYLVRTSKDDKYTDFIWEYRTEMSKKGIKTIGIMPATKHAQKYQVDGTDQKYLLERTPMPVNAYGTPMTMMIYGNKVALICYGESEIATIITSPIIAAAFREMFMMMKKYWEREYNPEISLRDQSKLS